MRNKKQKVLLSDFLRHCEEVATDEAIQTTRLPRRLLAPRNDDYSKATNPGNFSPDK